MPNKLDEKGLEIKSFNEVRDEITKDMKDIYGEDINVESNTPDGQLINILAQVVIDMLELIQNVYNSFDPDKAIGTTLDSRVAINNIQRKGGSYSYTNADFEINRPLQMKGLDQYDRDNAFTVSDAQGNKWVLAESQNIETTGTKTFRLRAYDIGAVESLPNTITNFVSSVVGVVSVNNPYALLVKGENEESDAELKIRRQKSASINSQGYNNSLLANLLSLDGVSYAKIYENITNVRDLDDIAGHSIWVIVDGGNNDEIAETIYERRNAGCGMKGETKKSILQSDGSLFEVAWDRPTDEPVYIKFDLTTIKEHTIDPDYIKQQLVSNLKVGIYSSLDINTVAMKVREIDTEVIVSNVKVSIDNVNWYDIVYPQSKASRLTLSTDRIQIGA